MSRLYFSDPDGAIEVKGWERAHLGGLADDVAMGIIGPVEHADPIARLINPEHYMSRYPYQGRERLAWAEMFSVALRSDGRDDGPGNLLQWRGRPVNGWHLMLNTAVAVGSDAIKLAVRLHSQSEIHAWIDGPDRAWVADIIESAVNAGVYRRSLRGDPPGDPARSLSGWEQVIPFLRADDRMPVVTHYSITEWFPNEAVAGVSNDRWEQMSDEARWAHAMCSLRDGEWADRYSGLRIKPDDWDTFRFGHGLTAFDLYADDAPDRLDKILGFRADVTA